MNRKEEQQELEELLRAGNAAKFIAAVASAISGKADLVMLTVGAFAGEPELLYVALKYASLRGVTVTLEPQSGVPEAA